MTTTESLVDEFKALQRELWVRDYLTRVLDYDGETSAPAKGAAARAEAMAALAGERHEIIQGPRAQELVQALQEHADELDAQTAAELAVFARDQREAAAIPADEAAAWARLTSEANAVWHAAKADSDWASFEPYVERIVETLKRHAAYLDDARPAYDVLLDQYERGTSTAFYDAFFDQVRATVVPLVGEIASCEQPRADFLSAPMTEPQQLAVARDLMRLLGLDMDAVSLNCVEHPFSDGFAPGDARVTTHIYVDNPMSSTFSVIHESGHALYELGVDPAFGYTCLAGGTSMGIHESQSRFFENYVARSRAFMGPMLGVMRAQDPATWDAVDEDALYRAVNIARPGLIRMDADELTYPLHIMVRYEIERALFAGEVRVSDIPALWRKLTRDYLGLDVPNDALGCLQDTHWSGGSFGYFPSYALGSAYGAQYLARMHADGVDVAGACAAGDLAPVRTWLGEKIWRWGRSKDAPELIQEACGAPFDASFYCDYLDRKFRDLYRL